MVVRPKHVADNLNKIVNNYWNRVALDGNSWTWYFDNILKQSTNNNISIEERISNKEKEKDT
jgi:hypothetical protein